MLLFRARAVAGLARVALFAAAAEGTDNVDRFLLKKMADASAEGANISGGKAACVANALSRLRVATAAKGQRVPPSTVQTRKEKFTKKL